MSVKKKRKKERKAHLNYGPWNILVGGKACYDLEGLHVLDMSPKY